jgi:hypothetical protein
LIATAYPTAELLKLEEQIKMLSKTILEGTPRLSGVKFDESETVSLLSFLDRFVIVMRESNRSEAVALVILGELLSGSHYA